MTGARALAAGGLLVALAACHPTRSEQAIVRRWLLCEECNRGELEAVVALKDHVTGMLAEALKGPSASGREHIRRQAQERFERLASPSFTSSAYVAHYDSNYVASYQAHAAIALGRIGTSAALAALYGAMQQDSLYGYDVIRAFAAAAPISLDTAAGASQAAPRDSVVRIDPAVLLHDSVTGQAVPNVRVVFTVDSGGGKVTDSIARTGANGMASTQWTLGPGPDSVNVLRATAFRRSVMLRAVGHGLTPRLVFAVQPSSVTQGSPIVPAVEVLVLDAWDGRDSSLVGTAEASVIGTAYTVTVPVVKGFIDLSTVAPNVAGAALRLKVALTGATPVVSDPFDVAP
jgi:hypothetical protein